MKKGTFLAILLIPLISLFISACTQKKFSFLAPADADAPPKTPGYHDPNTQKYGLPQPQKPVIENEFYWKSTPDKDVQAPD